MSDPKTKLDDAGDQTTPVEQKIKVQVPELLGEVTYEYSNLVRLASSETDVRLAFGDITPTGKLVPKFGVALSPAVAKSLLKALTRIIESLEERLGAEIQQHQGIEIVVDVEGPPATKEHG